MNKEIIEKDSEHLLDVISEKVSSCCGAQVFNPGGDEGAGMCMDCKEHCDEVDEDSE